MQKLERMINRRVWLWIVLFLAGLFFCWIIFSKLSKNIINDDNTQVTGRLIHNTKEAGVTVNGEEKIQKTQSIWLVKEWKSDSAQLSLENDGKETTKDSQINNRDSKTTTRNDLLVKIRRPSLKTLAQSHREVSHSGDRREQRGLRSR